MAADLAAQRGESDGDLMREAIRPDEGSEALCRALASDLTQVFITARPMPDLIAGIEMLTRQIQADAAQTAADAGADTALSIGSRHERPDLANAYVAPRDAEEEKLASMWSELLGIEPVGAEDSFFDLGGHSLLATRVLARVQDLFGVRLPMRAIFEAPTVAGLAEQVRAALWAADAKKRAASEVEEDREEIEL
jgi:acyl carrier protein